MNTTHLFTSLFLLTAVAGCDNDRTGSTTDDAGSNATRPGGAEPGATGTTGMSSGTRSPATPAPTGQGTAVSSGTDPKQPTDAGNSGGRSGGL